MTVTQERPLLAHAGRSAPVRQAPQATSLTAPGRYRELELFQQRLLAALAAHGGEASTTSLAAAAHAPEGVVRGRMIRLCEIGMARQTPGGWQLEPSVAGLAAEDLRRSLHVALVLPQEDLLRPPCDSHSERLIYRVCLALFQDSVVLPNVPLSRVIDPGAAAPCLEARDLEFLRHPNAALDIVVLSRITLMPALAIEADGPQHDGATQTERDGRKNRVCRVAGLPLVRVRMRERMSEDVLAHHLGRALGEVARLARPGQRGHDELASAISRLA